MADLLLLAALGLAGIALAVVSVWGADARDAARRQRDLDAWYRENER